MASQRDENNTPQPHGDGAVETSVRNLVSSLVSLISTNLTSQAQQPGPLLSPPPTPLPAPPPTPLPAPPPAPRNINVQSEMTRSFPGYFNSNSRGKKRCLTAIKHLVKIPSKTAALTFYLLPKNTSRTPLPAEELELLQAGMGKQTVSVPQDGDHSEVSSLLTDAFLKMKDLKGGWLLHKATGGSGRRKLTVIPPEAEGYSVKALRAVSAGGKATLYIVPLQENLDTSPLPLDSDRFSKMPKTACYQCEKEMPLQILAVHIKTCTGTQSSMGTDESDDDVCIVESKQKVVCPICSQEYPDEEISVLASLCGESDRCEYTVVSLESGASSSRSAEVYQPKSMEDVLQFLQQQVDTTTQFKLCVDREELPERGILQWKRKKAASPASVLSVVYIGEAGIDTGALRKEFLTDMISGVEKRFFEGAGNQGKNPKYSLTDLDNDNFRIVGEIMAVSLAQGGPPPAFLREWCYNFLCTGEVDLNRLSQEDVLDVESSQLISKVENSSDAESLMLLADEIVSCGYTSQIKMETKENIIRAIVLHSTTRLIPMLQQIRKGMGLYGLVGQIAANPEACHSLFVPGKIIKPDADFIMMNCQPNFSERGTSKERTERKIINFLQDFLEEMEIPEGKTDESTGDTQFLEVQHVLQWMTGQSHIPLLPDEKKSFSITCNFTHDCREQLGDHLVCYPTVSACTQTVTFPVEHLGTYDAFKRIMTEAVRYGGGFHRV